MSGLELRQQSILLKHEIRCFMSGLKAVAESFNLPAEKIDTDGEPIYTEKDLIWKNPNYEPH
jgi:hypothetical protein